MCDTEHRLDDDLIDFAHKHNLVRNRMKVKHETCGVWTILLTRPSMPVLLPVHI